MEIDIQKFGAFVHVTPSRDSNPSFCYDKFAFRFNLNGLTTGTASFINYHYPEYTEFKQPLLTEKFYPSEIIAIPKKNGYGTLCYFAGLTHLLVNEEMSPETGIARFTRATSPDAKKMTARLQIHTEPVTTLGAAYQKCMSYLSTKLKVSNHELLAVANRIQRC